MRRCWIGVRRICAAILLILLSSGGLFAQSHEQILERCRQSVGRPIVQACMARGGSDLEACRKTATPTVRACVAKEEQRIAGQKAAPAAPPNQASQDQIQPTVAAVETLALMAPPRTIADITAILDQEKPDVGRIARAKSIADASPPSNAAPADLAQFHYNRATAHNLLSRNADALVDAERAVEIARGIADPRQTARFQQLVAIIYQSLGQPKKSIEAFQAMARDGDKPGVRGTTITSSRAMAQAFIAMGDVNQAEATAKRVAGLVQEARGSPHPNWRRSYEIYGNSWESDLDSARALILESKGQYKEAEVAYKRAEEFRRASLKDLPRFDFPPPAGQIHIVADRNLLSLARVKAKQGRLVEAETDARKALLGVLARVGKYNAASTPFIVGLAEILIEQGRSPEAEQLLRSSLDVVNTLGIPEDAPASVNILSQLGSVLVLQGKDSGASEIYQRLDKATETWEAQRRDVFALNSSRITALYGAGRVGEGISAAKSLIDRQSKRFGTNHFETASARAILALGQALAGNKADAVAAFKVSIPVLLNVSTESDDNDDSLAVAARRVRLQGFIESYLSLLASDPNTAAETFALADAVRGQAVQQAVAASSLRMAIQDESLAVLVRNTQDLEKQINAQLAILSNALSLPSVEREERAVREIGATVEKLRADRKKLQQEIVGKSPKYAELIDPKPISVDQVRSALKPDEAFISVYVGKTKSFVWAITKHGKVAFSEIPAGAFQIEEKVRSVRQSLEAQAVLIADIPVFNLDKAHELYALLLKPIEGGWKQAKNLIVAANGSLGLLPFPLLPTSTVHLSDNSQTPFSEYKKVPWLALTHSVTTVPSAMAFRTLRSLPKPRSNRKELIAFGDPFFSLEQADEAQQTKLAQVGDESLATRGIPLKRRSVPQIAGVDSAELALLPRLPDTAEELNAIAEALNVSVSASVKVGRDANENNVKTSDLENYRILAFATHGLVPGELNGLTQPALALTAPAVAGVDGDGLLTMAEILSLKLDADWVILSACNSGSASEVGAEAASGLGRAFFYAGARTLLVTNWAVHSQSARELVTDVFRRQSKIPGISRSEALRQAMVALIEGDGFKDEKGKPVFSYAHPLFWAPYSIIGDGG